MCLIAIRWCGVRSNYIYSIWYRRNKRASVQAFGVPPEMANKTYVKNGVKLIFTTFSVVIVYVNAFRLLVAGITILEEPTTRIYIWFIKFAK